MIFFHKTAIYVLKYFLLIFGHIYSFTDKDRPFRVSFDKNVVTIIIFTEYGYILIDLSRNLTREKIEIECSLPTFFNAYSFRASEKNPLLWAQPFRELGELGKLGKLGEKPGKYNHISVKSRDFKKC